MIGRTKGGVNTKLHAVTDATGRPLRFFMTVGQVSDYTGAAALLGSLPAAEWLIADRGYDADWFRDAVKDKGIRPRIPGRKSRAETVHYDRRRYRRRNRIEIMFGRLKDWRRVATSYDRCPKPSSRPMSKVHHTRNQARADVCDYIEPFYTRPGAAIRNWAISTQRSLRRAQASSTCYPRNQQQFRYRTLSTRTYVSRR